MRIPMPAIGFVAILLIGVSSTLCAQHFGFSSGLYRVPYANATLVHVSHDPYDHDPPGKYDLTTEADGPFVVAAADGWVRWIEEDFDTSCVTVQGGQIIDCCWEFNNFLIIEHPNGEWSQYTHMRQGSVTDAGISLNEWVTAGTVLGREGTVGCSTGDHLHFEVSRPLDPTMPFDTIGGFLDFEYSNGSAQLGEMLIPVVAGIGTISWMVDEADHLALPINDNCVTSLEVIGNLGNGDTYVARADDFVVTDDSNPVSYASGSSSIYRAGEYILFKPGFHADAGAKFKAIIKSCNEQN